MQEIIENLFLSKHCFDVAVNGTERTYIYKSKICQYREVKLKGVD